MKEKYLIVVDMQNDFVSQALGTPEAQAVVEAVVKKVQTFQGQLVFTMDTHFEDYGDTQEGKLLPVPHCIIGSQGWEIIPELQEYAQAENSLIYEKNTFGSISLMDELGRRAEEDQIESIELVGLCTDICVVSNALLLKARLTEVPIFVDPACCAGTTPQKHQAALDTMASCQIIVK